MRTIGTAIIVGTLLTAPAAGVASPGGGQPSDATMHATKGVVRFVDETALVIARSPATGRVTRFVLTPATERAGDVTVGATVEVRYRKERGQNVASVVSVERRGNKPAPVP